MQVFGFGHTECEVAVRPRGVVVGRGREYLVMKSRGERGGCTVKRGFCNFKWERFEHV